MNFKIFIEDDDFWKDFFFKSVPKVVKKDSPQIVPYELILYRGFNANLNDLEREGNYYVLSPNKSEQGLIWFTHNLIGGSYDPIEYAKGHGDLLLTYPLKCKRHIEIVHYDDGTTSNRVPQNILDMTNPLENSQFHMGIELPDGWVFSYKTEKFVGCSKKLKITPNMLQKV